MASEGLPAHVDARSRWDAIPSLLVLAAILALALVPDHFILRTKVVWTRAALLGGLSVALLVQSLTGRLRIHWPTFFIMALAPGLLALLHPLHTPVASASLAEDEIQRLLLLPFGAWAAATALDSARWRRGFILALAFSGVIVGGYAVLQRLGGMLPEGWLAQIEIFPRSRPLASFGNPVFLGAWLVLSTPLLLAEALTGRTATRWLAAVGAGLCIPALIATSSVGAWFGFGLALLVSLWLLLHTGRQRLVMAGTVLVGTAATLMIGWSSFFRSRVHTLIWRDSWNLVTTHPGGIGPGQFQVAFLPYASPELLEQHPLGHVVINDAHSEPLQLLLELGWPALISVLIALGCAAVAARNMLAQNWKSQHERALFVAALASIIGALGQSFVSPDLRFQVSVLMLALLVGFLSSQAPALVLDLKGRKVTRPLVLVMALAGLWLVTTDTWKRIHLEEMLRPSPPTEISPQTAEEITQHEIHARLNENDPQAWYELGTAYYSVQRHAEAAEAFRKTLDLAPENTLIARNLGVCQALSGRYNEAVVHLRRSLAEDPDAPDIRWLLAYASFGRGDLRTAFSEVERILREYPDHDRARILLTRLRE
ncbi:MAG: tetratricopeptide repeat protein [Planctomycetota bacterium]|nr:tetratricopeptide repeat protein [Planctomycetota bacterium]